MTDLSPQKLAAGRARFGTLTVEGRRSTVERKNLVAKWELHFARTREFKYYRLTLAGQRQLRAEISRWEAVVEAIASDHNISPMAPVTSSPG